MKIKYNYGMSIPLNDSSVLQLLHKEIQKVKNPSINIPIKPSSRYDHLDGRIVFFYDKDYYTNEIVLKKRWWKIQCINFADQDYVALLYNWAAHTLSERDGIDLSWFFPATSNMLSYLDDALKNTVDIQSDYQYSLLLQLSAFDFYHHRSTTISHDESPVFF